MQVGELDLHRGGHQVGVGLDDHGHNFGVEDGGVTVEQTQWLSFTLIFFISARPDYQDRKPMVL